jgi:CIC family chloride channel protein
MVIGGIVGAVAWRFGHDLPGFPQEPGPVVIICMIALFGSIAHAPLAMLLMVGEMTGNLSLLAPAMVAVAIATLVVGDNSIYESQVDSRDDSPAHRHRFAFPLLAALSAGRATTRALQITAETPVSTALAQIRMDGSTRIVVPSGDNEVVGETTVAALQRTFDRNPSAVVRDATDPVPAVVPDDAPLDAALDLLLEHDRGWLPVVDAKGDVLGTIDAKGLMRTYHEAEEGRFRPLDWSPAGTEVFDVVVDAAAPVVGLRLRDADFPSGMRVVAVERSSETVVADGDTLIASGDRLTITCTPGTRADAFWFFQGHDARIAHETYLDDSAPTQPGARA